MQSAKSEAQYGAPTETPALLGAKREVRLKSEPDSSPSRQLWWSMCMFPGQGTCRPGFKSHSRYWCNTMTLTYLGCRVSLHTPCVGCDLTVVCRLGCFQLRRDFPGFCDSVLVVDCTETVAVLQKFQLAQVVIQICTNFVQPTEQVVAPYEGLNKITRLFE